MGRDADMLAPGVRVESRENHPDWQDYILDGLGVGRKKTMGQATIAVTLVIYAGNKAAKPKITVM